MEKERKNIGLIIILCILVLGLGGYIAYDKLLSKDTNNNTPNNGTDTIDIDKEDETKDNDVKNVSFDVKQYKDIANEYSRFFANKYSGTKYGLVDINKDNIPELIMFNDAEEASRFYTVYSWDNGKVIYLGMLSAGHTDICLNKNELQTNYAHMGTQIEYHYEIKDYVLVETSKSEKNIPGDQEYSFSSCDSIKFYTTTDNTGFDNYK